MVALPIEVIEDDDYFYEVLPYFKGFTLFQLMSSNKVGVRGELLERWAADLLDLIKPIHTFYPRIIHRDISPFNLLVSSDNLRLILLDFSSAIFMDQNGTSRIIATPGFTSPEQREGNHIMSSDIYSIGAILYYLNTCKYPPTIEDRKYRGVDIVLQEPIRYRLNRAIRKMFALDPSERFGDATEALEFLQGHTTTEMISLEPVATLMLPDGGQITMSRHDWKWSRPNDT
jgi:serine/threonine protein kinase